MALFGLPIMAWQNQKIGVSTAARNEWDVPGAAFPTTPEATSQAEHVVSIEKAPIGPVRWEKMVGLSGGYPFRVRSISVHNGLGF